MKAIALSLDITELAITFPLPRSCNPHTVVEKSCIQNILILCNATNMNTLRLKI